METNLANRLDNSISGLWRGEVRGTGRRDTRSRSDELDALVALAELAIKTPFPGIPTHRLASGRRRLEALGGRRDVEVERQQVIDRVTRALARRNQKPSALYRAAQGTLRAFGLPTRGRGVSWGRLILVFSLVLLGAGGYFGYQSIERADLQQTWVSVELVTNPPTPTATSTPIGAGSIVGQVFVMSSPTPRATATPLPTVQPSPSPPTPAPILPASAGTGAKSTRAARGITIMPDAGDGYKWRAHSLAIKTGSPKQQKPQK